MNQAVVTPSVLRLQRLAKRFGWNGEVRFNPHVSDSSRYTLEFDGTSTWLGKSAQQARQFLRKPE